VELRLFWPRLNEKLTGVLKGIDQQGKEFSGLVEHKACSTVE
jgi:hypothetical protein